MNRYKNELTMPYGGLIQMQEDRTLEHKQSMDQFLKDVERRAFRFANIAVHNRDDALDIIQDTMIRFVKNYAKRPQAEWRALFYKILRNRIIDHQRSQSVSVRRHVMTWFGYNKNDEPDPIAAAPDTYNPTPDKRAALDDAMGALECAVEELPDRQKQAFLLRTLSGMSVAGTAKAMGCSTGSVKTHYHRAVHSLRAVLGDHWS
jgi:RNA polymerase sigma-70 factor, ECF subfamily